MPTKTFQAETMMQALKLVQEEMGPSAIVLSVRDVQLGLWRRSGVEVVAITPDSLPKAADAQPKAAQNGGADKKEQKIVPPGQPIIRPSASGRGVEFDEEMPEIEWEEPAASGAQRKAAQPKEREAAPVWQPRHIRREDIATVDRAALFRGDPATAGTAPRPAVREPETTPIGSRAAAGAGAPEPLQKIQRMLAAQGLDRDYLDALMQAARESIPAANQQDEVSLKAWFMQELAGELTISSIPGLKTTGQSIVLVGASGSGKTSTIAKLAYYYSQVQGRRVVWICGDTIRTGAIAETRSYTDALGIPLRLVYTIEDLASAFPGQGEADLCLVDMPGYNPYSETQMVDLGTVLTEIPNRVTYLVGAATFKDADLNQAVAALGLYTLDGLIITRLDETMSFGSAYNLARSSRLPLSFFTTGKEANGNLLIADPRRLVSALFGKGWIK